MTATSRAPGPHKVLLAFYALFTVAAGARALVQLTTQYDEAPVAYWLSLAAAVTYALGWYAIREASVGHTGFASVMLWVELGGRADRRHPHRWSSRTGSRTPSVWSDFGIGYGFVPRRAADRRPAVAAPPEACQRRLELAAAR